MNSQRNMSLFLLCLISLFFSSAFAAPNCSKCISAKAAFFASNGGLSSGSCGYGPIALNMYGGHTAAALPSIYNNGEGCGACYQIKCKKSGICKNTGTTIVVTDLHTDKSNTTDFVLSSRAFRAMALPGKDKQLLQIGIADVEYQRVPCVYKRHNLALRVEKFSKFPNYLAVTILYQGGQTRILGGEVAVVDEGRKWESLKRNYGAVWDTSSAPSGNLMFRFTIMSGYNARPLYIENALPSNWKPGVIYNTRVRIDDLEVNNCSPCPWI